MTEEQNRPARKLLRLRKRVKEKKPKFARPESWRYVRLKENWRKPRGLDHKVRLKYKGWPPAAAAGYRGPKVARGLHPSGYVEVLVYNIEMLDKINPETQAIRIAHTVGRRKKATILAEARKKKITILNLKEVKQVIKEEKTLPKEKGKEEESEKKEETEETAEIEEVEEPKPEKEKPKRKRRTDKQ